MLHEPILARTSYYTPGKPGASRTYSDEFESMWCCTGTGFEAPGKYGQMVFTRAPDNSSVTVQLFASAALNWVERSVRLIQETSFPYSETSCIKITKVGRSLAERTFAIKVRRLHRFAPCYFWYNSEDEKNNIGVSCSVC